MVPLVNHLTRMVGKKILVNDDDVFYLTTALRAEVIFLNSEINV
jgi:hypothetical protein